MSQILYLNARHLASLEPEPRELVDVIERAFRYKARGQTEMPPKIFFQMEGDRFYSAMASCCPPLGFAGAKWQSGDPDNPARGLPYVQGLYVLNEHATGRMVAIMDAKWITGKRTAAASALVARYQARPGAEVLALLGCGVQGRAHLEFLASEVTSLATCRAYDVVPDRQSEFVEELDGRHGGIRVTGSASAEAAVREADIVVTGGPIQAQRRPTIVSDWIRPGALVVTIDYDSYVTDDCIAAMDLVLTDDRGQIQSARQTEGRFLGVDRIDAEIGELVEEGRGRRLSGRQRVLAFNLGIALEDLCTAVELFARARSSGTGLLLDSS